MFRSINARVSRLVGELSWGTQWGTWCRNLVGEHCLGTQQGNFVWELSGEYSRTQWGHFVRELNGRTQLGNLVRNLVENLVGNLVELRREIPYGNLVGELNEGAYSREFQYGILEGELSWVTLQGNSSSRRTQRENLSIRSQWEGNEVQLSEGIEGPSQ